jgi:competence protein ComEA
MKIFAILIFSMTLLFSAVDINTASAKELATLKGVGMKKASRIIEYRKKHCFKSVKELKKVKGIKKKTLRKNKGNITVSKCVRKDTNIRKK